jgi:hypothetical protein
MIRKVKKIKKTKAKIFQDEMFSYGAKNNIITATIIFVYILLPMTMFLLACCKKLNNYIRI